MANTIAIICAYNCENTLPLVLDKINNHSEIEYLVVNDCSTDNTSQIAMSYNINVVNHNERRGVGAAIKSGVKFAIENNFENIVVMAGNGKDNPEEIPILLNGINEGYDYIQGSRFVEGGKSESLSLFRTIMVRVSSIVFWIFSGFKFLGTDSMNGFRAYKTKILEHPKINIWQDWLDKYEYEMYLHYQVIKLGFKIKEVPVKKTYKHFKKNEKKSHIRPFVDWWNIFKPILYLSLHIKK